MAGDVSTHFRPDAERRPHVPTPERWERGGLSLSRARMCSMTAADSLPSMQRSVLGGQDA